MSAAPEDGPFTTWVRVVLVVVGAALLVTGAVAVFQGRGDGGAAAFIGIGAGAAVLALVGPHIEAFNFAGIGATFRKQDAEDAMVAAIKEAPAAHVSFSDSSGALRRAEAHADLLRRTRVLWVDDNPGQNDGLRRVLTVLGVVVDIATTNAEALDKLRPGRYDVVISDIARNDKNQPDGRALGQALPDPKPWLIYYVRQLKPEAATPEALGITNRPDYLLHYVLDAVEREKYKEPAEGP